MNIFEFARIFQGKSVALNILEYLVNNNGEYNGSYRELSEIVKGKGDTASEVRNNVMWLVDKGFIYAESQKNRSTYICVDENWMNKI